MRPRKPATPISRPHFAVGLFRFLAELRENNNRPWFLANRHRYEADLLAPMLGFIADFAPRLHAISKRFVADARPVGGSMFRIYRDVRFSKDKSPYKTMAAAHFRHQAKGDVHAPGFYLHLEPGQVFMGAGIWHPDSTTANKIREAIAARGDSWKRVRRALGKDLELAGESLKRPPQGHDPEHPLIEDLKRKDFVVVARFSERDACRRGFIDDFSRTCGAAAPLVEFLTRAVGLPW